VSDTKTCARCQTDLPITTFEAMKGGYRTICRPCNQATRRQQRSTGYEPYLTNLVSTSKSKSRSRGFTDYEVTAEYLIDLWQRQEGRCAISGVVLTHHNDGSGAKDFNASIDRIDSQQGYIPGNVQLVALRVNLLKQSLSNDMLYWWVKTIYQYSCD
jgi:hypothetical protein